MLRPGCLSAALTFPVWREFWPLPVNASAHGTLIDRHLLLNLWVFLGLATASHVLLLLGLGRRREQGAEDQSAARTMRLEYLPVAAFTVLFSFLAWKAERLWALSRYTGAEPTALQVDVVGMQFAWYFRYPGFDQTFGRVDPAFVEPGAGNPMGLDPEDTHGRDDVVTPELVLPMGREVDLRLRALDVIHGFAIPEMRVKQNAVPGQTIHLHFTPSRPGTYAILCTQVCGLGHYRMNANLRVLPPAEFAQWLQGRERRSST